MSPILLLAVHGAPMFAITAALLRRPRRAQSAGHTSEYAAGLKLHLQGDTALAAAVPGFVRLAPADDAPTAIELSTPEGWGMVTLPATEVVSGRVWSGGRLVAAVGTDDAAELVAPNEATMESWGLVLLDGEGLVVRCHGAGALAADDVARLRDRWNSSVVPHAG